MIDHPIVTSSKFFHTSRRCDFCEIDLWSPLPPKNYFYLLCVCVVDTKVPMYIRFTSTIKLDRPEVNC
jgi:hypothetical protein